MFIIDELEVMPKDKSIKPIDRLPLWITFTASVISVTSYIYFYLLGDTLKYRDAISHMEIARRVIDSPTAGFAQLGGVWLPLPHLLMLPFIDFNSLYYSGLAGSINSMVSYVIASVLIYKIIIDLSGKRVGGVIGSLVFMTNPNILYMQSTPMTELLLFASMIAMVYYVQRWIKTDNYRYLLVAGVATLIGSLTRYEAWVLFAALSLIIVIVGWQKQYSREKTEGTLLAYLFIAGIGIIGWFAWNLLIYRNPLYFLDGPYGKPSLWTFSGDKNVGNWLLSIGSYSYAILDNFGVLIILLAIAGLIVIVAKDRLKLHTLPVISTLIMVPFFIYMVHKGERPLHVAQLTGALYNVRFGLLMIIPISIFIGYLVGYLSFNRYSQWISSTIVITLVSIFSVPAFISPNNRILTLADPISWQQAIKSEQTTAQYLQKNYHHGVILEQFFGNEEILFLAHVPLSENINEGSYRLWPLALSNPNSLGIDWIIMRKSSTDIVYAHLHNSILLAKFVLTYQNNNYLVYKRR